jgi:hypothetical protein
MMWAWYVARIEKKTQKIRLWVEIMKEGKA